MNSQALFDRAAATYDIAAFPFFTPFGGALVEFAAIQPDERVLDLGCGTGAALAPAARIAKHAVGIELSPAMAERARQAAPTAEVLVGDVSQKLDFDDGSFDVVLSAFVVFFMEDPTAALAEWRRVLAPGGRIVLSTWAAGDPRWSFERDIRLGFVGELPPALLQELGSGLARVARFDEPAKVQEELRAAGFDPEPSVEHQIEFVFRDDQDWWDWNWSHAFRAFLEALSEESRDHLRAQVRDQMEQLRDSRGYPRIYTALFSRAKP